MTTNPNFAALLTVRPDSAEERRLVYVRKLVRHPTYHSVKVVDAAILPFNSSICAVVLLSAPSLDEATEAFAATAKAFEIKIKPITDYWADPASGPAAACVFGLRGATPIAANRSAAVEAEGVRSKITLDDPIETIWFVTEGHRRSASQAMEAQRGTTCFVEFAQTAQAFLDERLTGSRQAQAHANLAAAETPAPQSDATAATTFSLTNVGQSDLYLASTPAGSADYLGLLGARQGFAKGATDSLGAKAYLWTQLAGVIEVKITYTEAVGNGVSQHTVWKNFSTPHGQPVTVVNGAAEAEYNIDLSKSPSVAQQTPVSEWLGQLLTTSSFDKPWPEDSYTGNDLAAYQFILSQIPDGVAPKLGTVLPGIIEAINYPNDASYPESAFNTVKSHLLNETTYFQYAQQWFGVNGVFSAMNANIVSAASEELTAATQLMGINDESELSLILNTIFNDILGFIRVIPVIGPAISAVIGTFWSFAQLSMGSGASNAIKATVAAFAEELVKTLQVFANETANKLSTLQANWGRLEEFADGVITGKIATGQFGVQTSQPGAGGTVTKLDEGYITATANGWSLSFYRALYPLQYPVTVDMYVSGSSTLAQPWNPAAGKFEFAYILTGVTKDSSNNDHNVFFEFFTHFFGSSLVLAKLFDPTQLGVDPLALVVGFDGWPRPIPEYGTLNLAADIVSID